ncbi:deacetylase, partial [Candidatus Pacearchaeota archaeon]|nr:deacetylase [Candidatus Pacearchaeota archaeon]
MQLIITVDTEGDDQWSEERRTNITTENAKYLPRFQELCEKYSYKPTYLVNYEMALDKNFVEFGKEHTKRGTCEIGSHPHAWNSPPDYNLTGNDIKYAPYLMEYPEEIIYEKVKFLTELLGSTFETNIVSHRAGRWGFNEAYARILEQLDYKVDCSVTPFVSWQSFIGAPNKSGGPDFRDFPTHAYFLDTSDISKPGSSSVLEIPMTVRINYSSILSSIYSIMPFPMAKRAMRGVFGPQVNQFRCIKRNT